MGPELLGNKCRFEDSHEMNYGAEEAQDYVSIPREFGSSFSVIRQTNNIPWPLQGDYVQVSKEFFLALLRSTVDKIYVDEEWYRYSYPDINAAIAAGRFQSARQHYVEYGFFEDRLPRLIEVDNEFYLELYPDVSASIQSGTINSPQWHFDNYGFREGRLPRNGWRLLE
jgi:hypothetical protein